MFHHFIKESFSLDMIFMTNQSKFTNVLLKCDKKGARMATELSADSTEETGTGDHYACINERMIVASSLQLLLFIFRILQNAWTYL